MTKLLSVLALLIIANSSLAQFKVSGKVNEEGKPSSKATVLLLNAADSSLIKSALTNAEGQFLFEAIARGKYFVSISKVGVKQVKLPVQVLETDIQVSDIDLQVEPKALGGVTVTARKPFLEQRADKLVVNIENSATAAGGTALEVLQKVPGVIVTNDNVSMVGKPSVLILIDGRTSQYQDITQLLKDMPANNIEKIEVVSNPSAKYDASGGGVINIVLKRTANLGMNGNVSLSGGVGVYNKKKEGLEDNFYRVSPAFNLNYRKGSWNVFGGYSLLNRTYFDNSTYDRGIETNRFVQVNRETGEITSHNFRFGADYTINKRNTVGVLLRGFYRAADEVVNNGTVQSKLATGEMVSTFETINKEAIERSNLSANVNWKHVFDSLGRELNVDADYANYQLDNTGFITIRQTTNAKSESNQNVDNPVNLGVFKLDYTHPFRNKAKMELGLKTTRASIDNRLMYLRNGVKDPRYSSEFLYKEYVNAGYVNLQRAFNKWELMAGVRVEQTIAKGDSAGKKALDRNYVQGFPSAFVSYKVNQSFTAGLQYSKRVDRPSFQQQNPFVNVIDSLTYTRGNPLLKPQTTDAYKFTLSYKNQPFFGISYNISKDVIFDNAPRQEGNLTYTTAENLAKLENLAFELNFPIKLGKKIEGFGSNQFIRNHYKADYLNATYDKAKWNWMLYSQITYRPLPTLSFEVNGFYMTRFLEEFLTLEPFGNINLGIQKTIWNKKGRISLNCNDILYTNRTKGRLQYQDINVALLEKNDSRSIRLAFNYSFGNQKLKAARNRNTGADAEAGRINTN
jgi:outer membrane receptor protein involved in Fe transport